MSLVITKSLCCDNCGRCEDFGLTQPAKLRELRKAAAEAGWKRSGKPGDAVRLDVCKTCIDKVRKPQ